MYFSQDIDYNASDQLNLEVSTFFYIMKNTPYLHQRYKGEGTLGLKNKFYRRGKKQKNFKIKFSFFF